MDDFDQLIVLRPERDRYFVRLSVLHGIDILVGFEAGHRVDGNLQRVGMRPDDHLHAGEHAAFERAVRVRQIHLDRHGAGVPVQRVDDPRDGPDKGPGRIGVHFELRALADSDQRHILFDHVHKHPHGGDVLQDQDAAR